MAGIWQIKILNKTGENGTIKYYGGRWDGVNIKKWAILPLNKDRAAEISKEYDLPSFLAMMLEIRGIRTREQIEALLQEDAEFFDPLLLPDMEKAVERIRRAVDNMERIAVYGDYDADGVTSTAILCSYLGACGADVLFYIPEREGEGYGLNTGAIDVLHERGVRLIVTVDNGIASTREVEYAKSLGIDVVITDHHRPQEELPKAVAVIDPFRKDCDLPYKYFSGVGVAFKLITALEGPDCDMQALVENYADLVTIGTIGDVVPLEGENRLLVKKGLKLIAQSDRLGLHALLEHAGAADRPLTAGSVAFTIVPRINATGRIGSPDRAVRLLISEDPEEAEQLACNICEDNNFRREIESEIYESVLESLRQEPLRACDRVLVVDGEDWHHGVIGIVASRLTEKFGKPCIIISRSGGEAKGSGRSVEGFSLFDAISSCSDLMTKFGGHPMAAGLTMPADRIEEFRRRINRYAALLPGGVPAPTLTLDCKLRPDVLNVGMVQSLERMEPFGTGNPEPLFGLFHMKLEEIIPVGGGKHLRLNFSRGGAYVRCMKFHMTLEEFPYELGDILDLAVTLDAKPFRGELTLSIFVRDMKLSQQEPEKLIAGQELYERYCRGERLTPEQAKHLTPDRDAFALVYRFLREKRGWDQSLLVLLGRMEDKMDLARLLIILDILEERGLISLEKDGERAHIQLKEVEGKVDLTASPLLRRIKSLEVAV